MINLRFTLWVLNKSVSYKPMNGLRFLYVVFAKADS